MNQQLRERMEESAEESSRGCDYCLDDEQFKFGAEWMHENEVVPRQRLLNEAKSILENVVREFGTDYINADCLWAKEWLEKFEKGGEG